MLAKTTTVYPIITPTSSGLKSYNFYLVKTKHSLFLVDAGVNKPESWTYFTSVLQENDFKLQDIDKIILTHSHIDHIGLLNRIREEIDIPVYAHPASVKSLKRDPEFIQQRINFFQELFSLMGCGEKGEKQIAKLEQAKEKNTAKVIKGDILPLQEGDTIDEFEVFETLGHAQDHLVLFHRDSGELFSGDHLIGHVFTSALIEPHEDGGMTPSLQQYEASLKKCLQYPITRAYSGHGDIISDPHGLVNKRLKQIETESENIKALIKNTSLTAAEIAEKHYQKRFHTHFAVAMSDIIGYLDRLEALQEVVKETRDGKWYFHVNE